MHLNCVNDTYDDSDRHHHHGCRRHCHQSVQGSNGIGDFCK